MELGTSTTFEPSPSSATGLAIFQFLVQRSQFGLLAAPVRASIPAARGEVWPAQTPSPRARRYHELGATFAMSGGYRSRELEQLRQELRRELRMFDDVRSWHSTLRLRQGLGFGVWGLGFRLQARGFSVQCLGCRVLGRQLLNPRRLNSPSLPVCHGRL
jgi:hypothetical protein